MQGAAQDLVNSISQTPITQSAVTELLTRSSHSVLNEPDILTHTTSFVTDVLADGALQRTSSEALWNTLSYTVRPGVVALLLGVGTSLVGVGVLCVGRGGWLSGDRGGDAALKGAVEGVKGGARVVGRWAQGLRWGGLLRWPWGGKGRDT